MSGQVTLEQVEQQAAQLPLHEQPTLITHLSKRFSRSTQPTPTAGGDVSSRQQREQEVLPDTSLCILLVRSLLRR